MPDSVVDINWYLVCLGLALAVLLPLALRFRWLESKNVGRWVRWLLWALLVPWECIALFFIYFGIRPTLVGLPVVFPIDALARAVFYNLITASFILVFIVLFVVGFVTWTVPRFKQPFILRDRIPPELTYRPNRPGEPPNV